MKEVGKWLGEMYFHRAMGGSMNPWPAVEVWSAAKAIGLLTNRKFEDVEKELSLIMDETNKTLHAEMMRKAEQAERQDEVDFWEAHH